MMASVPHPWNDKLRADGVTAWCIVRVVEQGDHTIAREPIALFNLDSAAQLFQEALYAGAQLEVDPQMRELFDVRAASRARRGGV